MAVFNWLIATNIDEVGISVFDFYSIGHICMGIGLFLFFGLLYTIPMAKDDDSQIKLPLWGVFVLTVIAGIAWEFIENVVLIELGLKFENRADSIFNLVSDIFLVAAGGLSFWWITYRVFSRGSNITAYYVVGFIIFAIWLFIFVILRYVTYHAGAFTIYS